MLDENKAILIVIDIQGKLAELVDNKELTHANARRMLLGAQALRLPIIITEQNKLGETAPSIAELLPEAPCLIKNSFSCWGNEEFREMLLAIGRQQAVIIGLEAHICVYQTARDLLRAGWEVFVVADAVASRQRYNRRLAIQRLRTLGAQIVSTEMALFEMLETAEHPAARKIFEIVKNVPQGG